MNNIEIKDDSLVRLRDSLEFVDDSRISILTQGVGDNTNATICIEECSELIKEITKKLRDPFRGTEPMIEEIADVIISIKILMNVYHLSKEELLEMYERKMDRNLKRK